MFQPENTISNLGTLIIPYDKIINDTSHKFVESFLFETVSFKLHLKIYSQTR